MVGVELVSYAQDPLLETYAASIRDCGPSSILSFMKRVVPPSQVPPKTQKLVELLRDELGKIMVLAESAVKTQVICSALPVSLPSIPALSIDAVMDLNSSKCNRIVAPFGALESRLFDKIQELDIVVCFDLPENALGILQVADFAKRFKSQTYIMFDPYNTTHQTVVMDYYKLQASASKSGSIDPSAIDVKTAEKEVQYDQSDFFTSEPMDKPKDEPPLQVIPPPIDKSLWKVSETPEEKTVAFLTTITVPRMFYELSEINPYKNDYAWGILTTAKPFAGNTSASYFVNNSRVQLEFQVHDAPLSIGNKELDTLQEFQRYFFEVCLRGSTSQFLFDFVSDRKMYYVVPVLVEQEGKVPEIDWELVRDVLGFKASIESHEKKEETAEITKQLKLLKEYRDALLEGNKEVDEELIKEILRCRGVVDEAVISKAQLTDIVCQDSVFITPHNSGVYFGVKIREDLNPRSQIDFGKPKVGETSIVTYAKYFQDKHDITLKKMDQFMIYGRMLKPRNYLKPHKAPKDPVLFQAFVPIEIARIFPISLSRLLSAKALPSVLSRFETLSRSSYFCQNFKLPNQINLEVLSMALTSPSADDFYCYETLETVGDAILKLICSVELFTCFHSAEEGELTRRRTRIIHNKYLAEICRELKFHQYIQLKPFSIKSFYLPGKPFVYLDRSAQTKNAKEIAADILNDGISSVSENTLADVFEAVLGAMSVCYEERLLWTFLHEHKALELQNSFEKAISLLENFNFLESSPSLDDVSVKVDYGGASALAGWEDNPKGALFEYCSMKGLDLPRVSVPRSVGKDHDRTFTIRVEVLIAKDKVIFGEGKDRSKKGAEKNACHEVCKILFGKQEKVIPEVVTKIQSWLLRVFANLTLAQVVAFSNTAYKFQFARLAFLGDAFLDWMFVKRLYKQQPDIDPERISYLKQEKLSNRNIASVACKLGFHMCLQISDVLHRECEKAKRSTNDRDDMPLWLANTVEAFVGALAIDKKFDVDEVWKSCPRLFDKLFPSEEDLKILEEQKSKSFSELSFKPKSLDSPLSIKSKSFEPSLSVKSKPETSTKLKPQSEEFIPTRFSFSGT